MGFNYEYNCSLERVVDGDTVDCVVDLGFRIQTRQRFRLLGIDAAEPRGADRARGLAATEYLTACLKGARLMVRTEKSDSFGRWLADFYVDGDSESVSQKMIAGGHAVRIAG